MLLSAENEIVDLYWSKLEIDAFTNIGFYNCIKEFVAVKWISTLGLSILNGVANSGHIQNILTAES